jgi:Cu+-exporting ATPase
LADAIVRAAREKGLTLSSVADFESGSGIGVRGRVAGARVALGNTALMQAENVSIETLKGDAERLRAEGASVMYLAVEGEAAGLLAVADPVKATTPQALLRSKKKASE